MRQLIEKIYFWLLPFASRYAHDNETICALKHKWYDKIAYWLIMKLPFYKWIQGEKMTLIEIERRMFKYEYW